MAVTIAQLTQGLIQSGLMSADEVAAFQQGLPPQRQPQDAQSLARELVVAGKLTKYQAALIYQGRTKGLLFGEYAVLDKLGQGGMGVVLKAQHRKLGRIVAVKVLPAGAMRSPETVKRFYREVTAAGRLVHANIVTAYDAGESEGIHYLAMEYVEGKDLGSVVKERGPLEVKQALDCILQAAKGLEYAHGEGVIHRDIKPSNLLLDKHGTVKILDMGLARVGFGTQDPAALEQLTRSGEVMGTCHYMAPEQAEDMRHADQRCDIYSLGCTLYRLLAGKPPYEGDTFVKVILAHRDAPVPAIRDARPDVPERVDAIFQRMVAKRPEERYQSMAEVIADIEEYLGSFSRPPVAGLVEEPASEALPPSLAFLQDAAPIAATMQRKGTAVGDTLRHAGREETGASIVSRVKRAVVSARGTPLLMLAVAGAAAALVVVVGLLVALIGGRDTSKPPGATAGSSSSGDAKTPRRGPLRKGRGTAPPLAIAPFDAAAARKHQQAWADYLGVPVEFTNSIGMKFVLIPPGEFEMGSTQEEVDPLIKEAKRAMAGSWVIRGLSSEAPRHRVRITQAFYVGLCEVTQAQYQQVTGSNPSKFKESGSDAPVEQVSWEDAVGFCTRLSEMAGEKGPAAEYRLPTEAEWEYAARAGTTTPWSFGSNGAALAEHAWCDGNSAGRTHPVGQKKPNPFGLYDMHGNVYELCADWHSDDYYKQSPTADPPGPPRGVYRVVRGGAWWLGVDCRCAFRTFPLADHSILGFRVALSVARPSAGADESGDFPGLPEFPETPAAATPAPASTSPDGWSEPVNLGPTINTSDDEAEPALSGDGLILIFHSGLRPGGQGGADLWMCTRASRDEPFSQPVNLDPTVNSSAHEIQPALSADGLTLLFASDRPGGQGEYDFWMCKRASRDEPFGEAVNLGPTVNSSHKDWTPDLSADGLTLLFASDRPGGQGGHDLWMCQRASPNGPFGQPVNLGPTVNSSANDGDPAISADGLKLYFTSDRPGGQGDSDLWKCTRASLGESFGQPVNLGAAVNSSANDGGPALSADGLTLVFFSTRPGGFGTYDLWMCTRSARPGTAPSSSSPHPGPLPKGEGTAPPPAP